MRHQAQRHIRRRAITLLESAIVLPVVLVAGCVAIDLARAFHVDTALSQATYEAAMCGATTPYSAEQRDDWEATIESRGRECLQTVSGINSSDVTFDISTEDTDSWFYLVTVNTRYRFEPVLRGPWNSPFIEMSSRRTVKRFR